MCLEGISCVRVCVYQSSAGPCHERSAHVSGASLHRPSGFTWQTLLQVCHTHKTQFPLDSHAFDEASPTSEALQWYDH